MKKRVASSVASSSSTASVRKKQAISASPDTSTAKSTTAKASSSPKKAAPENWRETYEIIKELRVKREAPVDFVGCASLADEQVNKKIFRYQILCGLQLSSQTKDQVTAAAMERLKKFGLTPENIAKAKLPDLETIIYPVSFFRRKSEYMKQTAEILVEKYDGDVPGSLEGLLALPGIGMKMAHLCLQEAFDIVAGIGVDTHLHRLANNLGWVKSKNPDDTRVQLESWLPKEEWRQINLELVGLGQMIQQPLYREKLIARYNELKANKDQARKILRKCGLNVE